MQPSEKIQEYLKSVCEQVRWKKAHAVLSEEMEAHIIDQRDAFIAAGADESTATDKAIAQMGDPVTVGLQLDRTHRPKPQWSLLFVTVGLLLAGFCIRFFVVDTINTPWTRQLLATVIGLGCMAAAYFADFTLIGRYPKTFFFAIIALSAIAFIFAPRLDSSEIRYVQFVPLLFPLALSAIVYSTRNKGLRGVVICVFSFWILVWLAFVLSMSSGLLLVFLSGLILMSIAIAKNWFKANKLFAGLVVYAPIIIALIIVTVKLSSSRRMQIALNPSLDPMGVGYGSMAISALLNGSNFLGLGNLPAQYTEGYPLAYANSDYLLTYLISHLGWIAFIILMVVLLFFIIKGFMLCAKQKSILGLLVSVSVMLTFTMQVIGYVISNFTGLTLFQVFPLPLLSYANAPNIINLALIGFMLSVFRTGDVTKDKPVNAIKKDKFITWSDGKLTVSFR